MKLHRLVLQTLLLVLPVAGVLAAEPAGPQRNLLVELRWVESRLSAALVAGVRDNAVVVGTSGSVSPRGSVTLGTQSSTDSPTSIQRLLVLNKHTASVDLGEKVPVQWLDYALDLPIGAAASGAGAARLAAAPRLTQLQQSRSFTITPHWPGGGQPVRVEFRAQDLTPGVEGVSNPAQIQMLGTVLIPMGQWAVVARSGQALNASQTGVLSSRDAQDFSSRELQIRVDLAP